MYAGLFQFDSLKTRASLYEGIDATLHVVATGVAEMLKYACNAYHGLKVGFANEIGNICKALGVDSHEVMRLFVQDTQPFFRAPTRIIN